MVTSRGNPERVVAFLSQLLVLELLTLELHARRGGVDLLLRVGLVMSLLLIVEEEVLHGAGGELRRVDPRRAACGVLPVGLVCAAVLLSVRVRVSGHVASHSIHHACLLEAGRGVFLTRVYILGAVVD